MVNLFFQNVCDEITIRC